jgi:hypothetical protein
VPKCTETQASQQNRITTYHPAKKKDATFKGEHIYQCAHYRPWIKSDAATLWLDQSKGHGDYIVTCLMNNRIDLHVISSSNSDYCVKMSLMHEALSPYGSCTLPASNTITWITHLSESSLDLYLSFVISVLFLGVLFKSISRFLPFYLQVLSTDVYNWGWKYLWWTNTVTIFLQSFVWVFWGGG